MLNKKQKTKTSYDLTSPSVLLASIYFSVEIESKEDYFYFISESSEKISLTKDVLIKNKLTPKYFDIFGADQIFDLKVLASETNILKDKLKFINPAQNKEQKKTFPLSYAEFLDKKNCDIKLSEALMVLKKENELPESLPIFNTPKIINNYFTFLDAGNNNFNLCEFDYIFPARCFFSIPFFVLGNHKPIEIFKQKISESVNLNDEIDDKLKIIFKNKTLETLDFDLLENAKHFDKARQKINFQKEINLAIQSKENTIVNLFDYPVFISFNENKEFDVRLPFLTFDMYAQTFSSLKDIENIEFNYHQYSFNKSTVSDLLFDIEIDYKYVLGQRIDFIHEPEMKQNLILNVKNRDTLEGDVYFEESKHDVVTIEEQPTLANMATIYIPDNPIMILTLQKDKQIVRQVNAYFLNSFDLGAMDVIEEFFLNMGGKGLKHVNLDNILPFKYCKEHLKINGLVI